MMRKILLAGVSGLAITWVLLTVASKTYSAPAQKEKAKECTDCYCIDVGGVQDRTKPATIAGQDFDQVNHRFVVFGANNVLVGTTNAEAINARVCNVGALTGTANTIWYKQYKSARVLCTNTDISVNESGMGSATFEATDFTEPEENFDPVPIAQDTCGSDS